MIVSPSRARTRRKWNIDKKNGPTVALAEKVLKKMVQHSFGCTYTIKHDEIHFAPLRGRTLHSDFWEALATCLRIMAKTDKMEYRLHVKRLYLLGPHEVLKDGRIRKCPSVSTSEIEGNQ